MSQWLYAANIHFYLCAINNFSFSEVVFDDLSITTATDQNIVCRVSGLSQNTPITWIDPNNNEISTSDTDNYVIDQGSFVFGSKASTLTIKTAKLAVLSSGDVFKCKLKSALYADDSPDVVNDMTLTLLKFGKHNKNVLVLLLTYLYLNRDKIL